MARERQATIRWQAELRGRLFRGLFLVWVGLAGIPLSGCQLWEHPGELIVATGESDHEVARHLERKGRRAFEHGNLEKAASLFERAVLAAPDYGPAHNNLGLVHYEQGDLYAAAWDFERAAGAMPDRPEPVNNLGLVYETAGRIEEAIAQFAAAHELSPNDPVYLANLVRARRIRGDIDASLEEQLRHLLLIETRPEWREWAEDQLVLFLPSELRRLQAEEEAGTRELESVPGRPTTPDNREMKPEERGEGESNASATSRNNLPAPSPSSVQLLPPESPSEIPSRLKRHIGD